MGAAQSCAAPSGSTMGITNPQRPEIPPAFVYIDECGDLVEKNKKEAPLSITRISMNVRSRMSMKPLSLILTLRVNLAAAAATTYTTVFPLVPGNCGEFAAVASLYDEYICDKIVYDRFDSLNGVCTSVGLSALAYDPMDPTALTSVAQAAERKTHQIFPHSLLNTINALNAFVSTPSQAHRRFVMKEPAGRAARNSADNTVFSGEWSTTSLATDQYGFLKPYFESYGGTSVAYSDGILYFHCRFRSRA